MSEIRQIRDQNVKFDITIPDEVPEFHVDGVSTAFVGVPGCKILFHSLSAFPSDEQIAGGIENRKAVLQLAIPLTALLEFANSILRSAEHNRVAMEQGISQIKAQIDSQLSSVSSISPQKE